MPSRTSRPFLQERGDGCDSSASARRRELGRVWVFGTVAFFSAFLMLFNRETVRLTVCRLTPRRRHRMVCVCQFFEDEFVPTLPTTFGGGFAAWSLSRPSFPEGLISCVLYRPEEPRRFASPERNFISHAVVRKEPTSSRRGRELVHLR